MERFKHILSKLLGGLALILLVHSQDRSEFISIDCGLPENSSYILWGTGIDYISDAAFIDSGISKKISDEFKSSDQQVTWSLRSFPEGIRNCYSINIKKGTKYLIRATFLYGNYDGKSKLPQFDLHLGANMWDAVKIKNESLSVIKELIHVPTLSHLQLCLVNTQLGTPFISAIELRPLNNTTYETTNGSLALHRRVDSGSVSNMQNRYGDDVFDRIWEPYNYKDWTSLSTSLPIESGSDSYRLPSDVMSTAATPIDDSAPFAFYWVPEEAISKYYIYMHFAEVEKLNANQSRSFNIILNGKYFYGPLIPTYLEAFTLYAARALTEGNYDFALIKTEDSTLPPIINAVEIYSVKDLFQSETHQEDVHVIGKIKSTYEIKRNWKGDPCGPQGYIWEGLNCSYEGYNPPRIISLNLSSSGLTGKISADISNLVMLQCLDLSSNSLTGSVPDFLSQLQYLTVLNLERNQLNGSIPTELLERSKNGSLSLSVGENSNLCGSGLCKKKNNIVIPIVASTGGFFILSLTVVAILWVLRRRKQQHKAQEDAKPNVQNLSLESVQRQFKYSDVQRITNNFEMAIGKGGFGTVYHGCVDDTQVAVKMLSLSSFQGYHQFEAEVKLLLRVHHKNLTSLIGYCYEGTQMGLIYEYMANGDLETHLSDADNNVKILCWKDRLQIALDTAQGLEYLHRGCKPPIVHRDVKPTNILLNENFQAKLADFGLSKILPTDGTTHVSTVVAGSPGYLDPEYSISNWLTEKSDVYSFGVVLLRIITNRPVIERSHEMRHISHCVSFMLSKGHIENIVDSRLYGDYNINSILKAVEIAMVCASPTSIKRPTMDQVVSELKECLAIELSQRMGAYEEESKGSIEMINKNMSTDVNAFSEVNSLQNLDWRVGS